MNPKFIALQVQGVLVTGFFTRRFVTRGFFGLIFWPLFIAFREKRIHNRAKFDRFRSKNASKETPDFAHSILTLHFLAVKTEMNRSHLWTQWDKNNCNYQVVTYLLKKLEKIHIYAPITLELMKIWIGELICLLHLFLTQYRKKWKKQENAKRLEKTLGYASTHP